MPQAASDMKHGIKHNDTKNSKRNTKQKHVYDSSTQLLADPVV